jgi:hypothetical protein
MSVLATSKLLIGRTIVGFELRPWTDSDPEKSKHYDPVFILDNGARVSFMVTETYEGNGYGVSPRYHSVKASAGLRTENL